MKENGSYLTNTSAILHSDQRNKNAVSTISSSARHPSNKISKNADYGSLAKNSNLDKEDCLESILLQSANSSKAFDHGRNEGNY